MKRTLISLTLVACPQVLHAQATVVESAEKEQFLALLDEQTAIATRTRINADFVPGMVTVLHGENLEARGARTVWEALALVPGMELAIEKTGRRKVLVRGLGNTWASGNLKILLNDVAMNSAELGLADPVFNIPVEQVERIEVIRGPGSAIHGEYAYMGVINVITRADENKVFAFGGSFDTAGVGAVMRLTDPGNPVQASLNLAGWRTSGADVKTGPDLMYGYGLGEFSYAPGRANEDVEAGTAVFKLGYQGFSLTGQWSEDGLGDHFGINNFLPPDHDRIAERWRHRTLDMRQEMPLTEALIAGVQLGWKDASRRRDDLFVFRDVGSAGSPDVSLHSRYLETSVTFGTDVVYRGLDNHAILLAASTGNVRVEDNQSRFDPAISGGTISIPEGTQRSINAVTLQDEYRHSDLFTLTTGLRYDEYSDVGVNYSPRIAGVWRVSERHVLKAQYAEAFRPPTLFEAEYGRFFGVDAIEPATIQTSELGYIFNSGTLTTRLTGFYSRLDDLVTFSLVHGPAFGNKGATAWGLEAEQNWRVSPRWYVNGNVSYADTRDEETGEPFPGAVQWIANVGASYERGLFLGALQAHHIDGYYREPDDPRDTLDGYTTVDLTGTWSHVLARGLHLRLGIKNLFDADVHYPAPIGDTNPVLLTYADDYPRAGRSWWGQLTWRY